MSIKLQGEIQMSEVSGAVLVPGGRLVVVSDENGVGVVDDALARFADGVVPVTSVATEGIDDIEDVTWDGSRVLAIASHGLNRRGEAKQDRRRILLLDRDLGSPASSSALQSALESTPELAVGATVLADTQRRTPAQSGLNIEGIACTKSGLWVGLRSPTATFGGKRASRMYEDAILLSLDPSSLTSEAGATARLVSLNAGGPAWMLNLDGNGVRGLASLEDDDLLILAGLSVDPNPDGVSAPWAVWRWTPGGSPSKLQFDWPSWLTSPEAISVVDDGRQRLLVLVQDAGSGNLSRYAAAPLP